MPTGFANLLEHRKVQADLFDSSGVSRRDGDDGKAFAQGSLALGEVLKVSSDCGGGIAAFRIDWERQNCAHSSRVRRCGILRGISFWSRTG